MRDIFNNIKLHKKLFTVTKLTFSFLTILFFSTSPLLSTKTDAAAGVSSTLSYQGRLTDTNGSPFGGSGTSYCFRFSIWNVATGGTANPNQLWPVSFATPSTMTVTVTNGVFNAGIGDTSAGGDSLASYDFSSNDTQYINVEVATKVGATCASGDGAEVFETLSPRQRLDSTAYARVAYSVYGGDVQVGTAAGVVSSQKMLKLDVNNSASTSETIGSLCSLAGYSNGWMWYNSNSGRTLVCNQNLVQVVGSAIKNQFFDVTGPTTAIKTFTLPDASATILTSNTPVTIAQGGTGTTTQAAGFNALSPLSVKGDLVVSDGTNDVALAVGAAGQVLTASTTAATGLAWATAAGGGGSVAGSDTQIQYNNAGAFGASTDFTWNNTTKTFTLGGTNTGIVMNVITNEPAASAAGTIRIYSKNIGGRIVPKWVGPAGVDTPFQSALYANNIVMWTPTNATAGFWQGTVGAGAGTYANVLPTATTFYTAMKRSTYATVVTTTNQQVGQRSSENMWWRGAVAGQGGFFYYCRFGITAWTAGDRLFVGLSGGTTAVVTVNPSTLLNFVGFGIDAGDTAISFMHNDGTATATKDAIAGQPALAANNGYEAFIYAKPNDTTVYYRLVNLNTGAEIVSSSATTKIPTATTMMAAHALMSNGANTAVTAASIGLNRVYIETDF